MFSHKIYLDPWMLVNPTRLKGGSDVVLRYVALEPSEWDLKSIAFDAVIPEQQIKKAVTLLIRRGYIRSLQTGKLAPTAMGVFYAWQLYGAYQKTDKPKAAGLPKLLVIWSLAHGARTVAQIVADTELNDGTVRQALAVLNEWGAAVKSLGYWRLAVDVENEFEPK